MSALSLFSCPLCGESIEIPELDLERDGTSLTCPICGIFFNDDEAMVAVSAPSDCPLAGRS